MTIDVAGSTDEPRPYRSVQLAAGIVCMVMIANLQYGWALFVDPIVYGVRHATINAGFLCTAKGTAALLVPFGNVLPAATGSWHIVFVAAAVMNAVAAIAALAVLKPLRTARSRSALGVEARARG